MANAVVTDGLLESEALYEIVNGERREITPMGVFAGSIASVLSQFLGLFGLQQKLGVALMEVLFRLKPGGASRRPDVAFVKYDRLPTEVVLTADPAEFDLAPNLAVEVVSRNNTAEEIEIKTLEYFDAGVELVWVIYPRQRRIYVYDSPTSNRILQENDFLDGGNVLPGFKLQIAELFAALEKPQ